jgi:hypothetical protein
VVVLVLLSISYQLHIPLPHPALAQFPNNNPCLLIASHPRSRPAPCPVADRQIPVNIDLRLPEDPTSSAHACPAVAHRQACRQRPGGWESMTSLVSNEPGSRLAGIVQVGILPAQAWHDCRHRRISGPVGILVYDTTSILRPPLWIPYQPPYHAQQHKAIAAGAAIQVSSPAAGIMFGVRRPAPAVSECVL